MNLARRKVEIGVWLAAAATTVFCVICYRSGPLSWADAPFMAYTAFPYVTLPLVTSVVYFRSNQSRPPFRRGMVLAIVTCAFPMGAYPETAFFSTSSTAGLAYLFLPAWTVVGSVVLMPLLLGLPSPAMRPGMCPSCGYNLPGNTSGVCPECGTRIPSRKAADA